MRRPRLAAAAWERTVSGAAAARIRHPASAPWIGSKALLSRAFAPRSAARKKQKRRCNVQLCFAFCGETSSGLSVAASSM